MKDKYFFSLLVAICLFFSIATVCATENVGVLEDGTNVSLNDTYNVGDIIVVDGDEYNVTNVTVEGPEIIGYENGDKVYTVLPHDELISVKELIQGGQVNIRLGPLRQEVSQINVFNHGEAGLYSIQFVTTFRMTNGTTITTYSDIFYFRYNIDEFGNLKYEPFNNVTLIGQGTGNSQVPYIHTFDITLSMDNDGNLGLHYNIIMQSTVAIYSGVDLAALGTTMLWNSSNEIVENPGVFTYAQVPVYGDERVIHTLEKLVPVNDSDAEDEGVIDNLTNAQNTTKHKHINFNETTDENNNINTAEASMKETGVPCVLLAMMILLAIFVRRN